MVKRYDVDRAGDVTESVDGVFVDYDDHAAELATLRAENERLRDRLKLVLDIEDDGAGLWVAQEKAAEVLDDK